MTLQRWIVLFALTGLIVGLVAQAPAALLSPLLTRATGNRLQLTDPAGTLWSGAGALYCSVGEFASPCGRLHWQVEAAPKGGGILGLSIGSSRTEDSARLSLSLAGWRLDQIDLSLPAALLGSFDRHLATLGLGGRLRVQGRDVTVRQGDVQLKWQQASSRLLPGAALGEHRVDLALRPEGTAFTVGSVDGPLRLAGAGRVSDTGAVSLELEIRVTETDRKLTPLLAMLGQPTGRGVFRLRLP